MLLLFCRERSLLLTLFLGVACVVTGCVRDDESSGKSPKTSSGQVSVKTPEAVKETQWVAERVRLEKEAVKLEGEVKAERQRNESLAKENMEVKAMKDRHEAKAGTLHWWLTAAVIAGAVALLGGMGLGLSVRREVAQKAKQIDRNGGNHVLEEALE